MGLFDRFAAKKPEDSTPPAAEKKPTAGQVLPQLAAAREKLKAKDLPAAVTIYEEVLAGAVDRTDVLVTISADLGTNGHVQELIELLAPRYDVQKHGPAAGINLLQAYLATRNAEAAQHLLDLLFALQRPDLEARLIGFSNAVAELFVTDTEAAQITIPQATISLISISKPIWFYGLEAAAPHLLPRKEGKLRRVAFTQCSLPGLDDAAAHAARPEEALGRLSRGLPLWLAETFAFGVGYEAVTAVGVTSAKHYALFPVEWAAENIRQLNDSSEGKLDYVLTGALRNRNDDFELSLRIWEVKKFRELKTFNTRWNPASADEELRKFHELVRGYMEWTAMPAGQGLAYTTPAAPLAHVHALGTMLTQFLGEKGLLAPEQSMPDMAALRHDAQTNLLDPCAQLALVSALLRLKAQGVPLEPVALANATAWLASDQARAADASALIIKLA
ncbi:MAG: hypothetical protein EXS42_01070 [Lacunisphaera sp.]|nr:hypothetical protein [Lacunisphaera sp.]